MVKLNQNASSLLSEIPSLQEAGLPALDRRLSDPVRQALETLAPSEQAVLDLRCGLSGESLSAEQVAAEFNASTEEVNAVTARALRALYRAPRN